MKSMTLNRRHNRQFENISEPIRKLIMKYQVRVFWYKSLPGWALWKNVNRSTVPCDLTYCSFHRIEQIICLGGTSINKGCAIYYYSVTHGLRIIRYWLTKCREKSVLRRLYNREQHTKFCIESIKRPCRVDLHVVIAIGYTALYRPICGLDDRYFSNEKM